MLYCELCKKSFPDRGMKRFCTELCRKRAEKARARLRDGDGQARREARLALMEARFLARVEAAKAKPARRRGGARAHRRRLLAERLEAFSMPEPNSGCRLWLGQLWPSGYGRIKVGGKLKRVHRAAYEEAKGPIPPGKIICHRCDVPICIEPNHLYAGTDQTNFDDMVRRGRYKPPPHAARIPLERPT